MRSMLTLPIDTDLALVAKTFVDLQEARHAADYNVATPLIRVEVTQKIDETKAAFDAWGRVRDTPNASVFLAALLLQRHWPHR